LQSAVKKLKLPLAARKVPPTQGNSKATSNIVLGRRKKKPHPMLIKSRCVRLMYNIDRRSEKERAVETLIWMMTGFGFAIRE
jgi:hypothetical protein